MGEMALPNAGNMVMSKTNATLSVGNQMLKILKPLNRIVYC